MSRKGKRIDKGKEAGMPETAATEPKRSREGEKKPSFWRRLMLPVRIAILSALSTTAVITAVLCLWNLNASPDQGVGTYTPPPEIYDDEDESGGTAVITRPKVTAKPTPQGLAARDNIYTFLLSGRRDGLTDTLMVATMDMAAKTINVISIPRDTVSAEATRSGKKINGAFNSGGGKDKGGMELLLYEIESLVGFMPKNFLSVDMKGFTQLVNAIDGVRFYVPVKMNNSSEGIHFNKGWYDLNGEQALKLVRYRGYGGSGGMEHDDYGRMQMQQMFLKEVAKKMLSAENLLKIPEFMDIYGKNIYTNMSIPEMVKVAELVFQISEEDITFSTLPTVSVKNPKEIKGMYYEMVKAEEALALINQTINPFNMEITADMVHYMKLTES